MTLNEQEVRAIIADVAAHLASAPRNATATSLLEQAERIVELARLLTVEGHQRWACIVAHHRPVEGQMKDGRR